MLTLRYMQHLNGVRSRACLLISVLIALIAANVMGEDSLKKEAYIAFQKSVRFYHDTVAIEGGYVFRYAEDLRLREGEGVTGLSTVWIQPPGTPAVGLAFLEAYERTGDAAALAAAKDAATCLIRGQLHSGGWSNSIEFEPKVRLTYAYRVDGPLMPKAKNITTLDDNKSQSAIRFLARLDQSLKFSDAKIHEATLYALDALVRCQYPNGAWPQGFSGPPEPENFPVLQASYPKNWSRQFAGDKYVSYYTLNDNTLVDTLRLMLLSHEIYHDVRYQHSAIQGGEFILRAQMPDPQPAWAQQYDTKMQPTWARKFEPPAISGGESQKVIETLLILYQETGDTRLMQSAEKALSYLKTCLRQDGNIARFQELQSNRPLYFTRDYKLTYEDNDLPTHYGFIVKSGLGKLDEKIQKLSGLAGSKLSDYAARQRKSKSIDRPDEKLVQQVIQNLDERGAWVEAGKLSYHQGENLPKKIIDSQTFIKNIDILSRYLSAD